MAQSEFYQVGHQRDVVGEYFGEVYKEFPGDPICEVQEFKNSETRLSLLKVNNRVKAFVIECRTEYNDLEFIFGTVRERKENNE